MDNFKPFDPRGIDSSLTRVVAHGGETYLLFPYIDAVGPAPKFTSVGQVITGAAASAQDLSALSKLVVQAGGSALWYIAFSTPWLITPDTATTIKQRVGSLRRTQRD
jgi:hypothetical protein